MPDVYGSYKSHATYLYSAVLADVLDALGHRTSALPSNIRPLKEGWRIFGRAKTLCAVPVASEPAHPYAVEMDCIDALKPGDVLVATTCGDNSSALWGELLSTASKAHGAVGVVMDGLTRDAAKIIEMDFPVFATGFSPLDSKGRLDAIHFDQPIRIGSCTVATGDLILGDIDGVVAVPRQLAEDAAPRIEKVHGENTVRDELAKGRSVREVFAEFGIL